MDFNFDLNLDMETILGEINKQKGSARFLRFAEGDTVIRLLPPIPGQKVPWAFVNNHFAQMPTGNWEAINCPQTDGKMCAICNKVSELYNSKDEENIKIAKKIKKNKKYYYNVLLISSPHPDFSRSEGQVFVMQVGPKINDIIQRDLKDSDIGLALFNPVDGFDFSITSKKNAAGLPNYDLSKTGRKKYCVVKSEEELKEIMEQRMDLQSFTQIASLEETSTWINNYYANIEDMMENSHNKMEDTDKNTDEMFKHTSVKKEMYEPENVEEEDDEEAGNEEESDAVSATIDSYLKELTV